MSEWSASPGEPGVGEGTHFSKKKNIVELGFSKLIFYHKQLQRALYQEDYDLSYKVGRKPSHVRRYNVCLELHSVGRLGFLGSSLEGQD